MQKGKLLKTSTFLCVFYLLDPRSSSDEALFIPAGEEESPPNGEE